MVNAADYRHFCEVIAKLIVQRFREDIPTLPTISPKKRVKEGKE
jgi:hypothetical protein